MMMFIDLLHDIEGTFKIISIHNCFGIFVMFPLLASTGSITVTEDGEQKELPLSLGDILAFTTGAAEVPPLGFDVQPNIKFNSGLHSDLPLASTCSNTLYLPVVHSNDNELFKYRFALAINCAVGFGQV